MIEYTRLEWFTIGLSLGSVAGALFMIAVYEYLFPKITKPAR